MGLAMEQVKKSYPDFEIDISFDIESGKLITLLGPSGCGKTTTLHIIAGFIAPDNGRIVLDGKRIDGLPPYRREAGLVFQDYALFPNMNVAGNIAFGLRMHGWSGSQLEQRVVELLDLVRLRGYERRSVTNLSGGEQQRVALARALAPNPKILLLDEPLSALDTNLRKDLRGEIRRIQRALGLTTVYVTHDQEEAFAISDRIAVMNAGRIEQVGTSQNIYRKPNTLFVARFVGLTNTVEARVLGKKGSLTEVDTAHGRFLVKSRRELHKGRKIVLIFRPENVRLSTDSSDMNIMEGRVRTCEYLGDSTLLELQSKGAEFTVKLTDTAFCEMGEMARITFSPEDCIILEAQD
jgi:ABC-type Fe3+/spermidine/putrescine transport system ATPase subunit